MPVFRASDGYARRMESPLPAHALTGKVALVTGSSRGIGADTARFLAQAGAQVTLNYRNKAQRAEKIVAEITQAGGNAIAIGADLTDSHDRERLVAETLNAFGRLDILVLNASGGMEAGMADNYAMALNRDAQVGMVDAAIDHLGNGSRIVFVTSHQAHFIRTTPTMPEYEPVARSKRAGEDALRARGHEFDARGIGFIVVSGDMIEGTITATLLERANPGAIESRRQSAGKLYNVSEFAAEVALACIEPIPTNHTKLTGDTSSFAAE